VAGWTLPRLARRPAINLPATGEPLDVPPESRVASASESLTDRMVRVASDLFRSRSTSDGSARVTGPPRLVSVASGRDHQLSRVVELEIIPRLLMMHGSLPAQTREDLPAMLLTQEHVDTLAILAAEGDAWSASSYVQGLLDAGATLEQLFLDLLAPSAKLLGTLWESDHYDFSQVTVGLWRLQQILHDKGAHAPAAPCDDATCFRSLMAAVPGVQHTFGVAMASEFFVRDGWDVRYEPWPSWDEIRGVLSQEWFDMFGLSVSTNEGITQAAVAIQDVRQASANPGLYVMVGGPMAAVFPDLATLCGADDMCADAGTAVAMAKRWLGTQAQAR
jgi:MerR family transcriptional regulator, light-induced transcriptional regulator